MLSRGDPLKHHLLLNSFGALFIIHCDLNYNKFINKTLNTLILLNFEKKAPMFALIIMNINKSALLL